MRCTGLFVPALALALLGTPGGLAAQHPEGRAHASVEVSVVETSVRESGATFAGVSGLLSLDGRLAFGAGGALMLGTAVVEGDGGGSDLDLRLAYGGLVIQVILLGSSRRYLAVRTLLGAGNAKLEVPVVGPEIAADNFGVMEPEVVGTVSLSGPLQVGLGAGYRHVFGVDDLPNVTATDLQGLSVRLRVSLRTH